MLLKGYTADGKKIIRKPMNQRQEEKSAIHQTMHREAEEGSV